MQKPKYDKRFFSYFIKFSVHTSITEVIESKILYENIDISDKLLTHTTSILKVEARKTVTKDGHNEL